MTITVGSNTPTGTYPITVTGNGGGIQQNTTVTLTVIAGQQLHFHGLSVRPHHSAEWSRQTSTITTTISNGFNSSISSDLPAAPSGRLPQFTPHHYPSSRLRQLHDEHSEGNIAKSGTYPITVTGNGSGIQQTATVTLTITAQGKASFTISAIPATSHCRPGQSRELQHHTIIGSGFSSSISLSASGLPTEYDGELQSAIHSLAG